MLGIPVLTDPHGEVIRLRSRKQLGLLVFLTLDARFESAAREKIADMLWQDSGKHSLHSLSQALTEIRQRLGREAIAGDRTTVKLQAKVATDIDYYDVESLPSQIPTPLEGLDTCGGPRFAQWVEARRDIILAQIEATLSDRLIEARAHGRVQAARDRAEQLYSIDPYNEAAVNALIGDRVDSGNWAGAFRLLKKHVDVCATDLGRTPSIEALVSLRRYERGATQKPRVHERSKGYGRRTEPDAFVFVGRETEMTRLETISNQVAAGLFRSCVLRGPDGIGKTTVLRRFVVSAAAAEYAPAYIVTCQKIGQSIPFAAVSDLLDQMSRDPALSGTKTIWLSEASRIAPGIKAAYSGVDDPPVTPPETVRVRLAEALKQMLAAIADGKPVYLAFDDLHFMDPASRDVLHMLARRLEGTPALLLAAVRSSETEAGPGAAATIEGVKWQGTIDLEPFTETETEELASALFWVGRPVDDAVTRKIVELSEGMPLLTEMLVSDWEKSGEQSLVIAKMRGEDDNIRWSPPDTMRSALAREYDGLSKCGQRLLHLIATAGRRMPLEDCCRLLAEPTEKVGAAVFTLIERSIVYLDGNGLDFKSDLHRAFVYSTLPDETRRYQHAHLAQHLSAAKDQSEFQYALEASHHFLKAGWIDEAKELACTGADRAITWGAPKEAQKALEAVIAVTPQRGSMTLRLLRARALTAIGKYQDALTVLAEWRPVAPTQREDALAATIRADALHRGRLENDATIKQALDLALGLAEKSGDDSLFVTALQMSAELASETGDSEALASVQTRTHRIGISSRQPTTKALARLSQGYCLLVAGDTIGAEDEFRKCVAPLSELHLDPELRQVYNGIGIACYCRGAMGEAISAFELAIKLANRIGDSVAAATSWSNLGAVHEDLGNLEKTHNCYDSALSHGEVATNPRRAVEFHLNAAGLKLITGDLVGADHFVSVARSWAEKSQLWWLKADVMLAAADTCLANSNPDEAWTLLDEAQCTMVGRYYALSNRGRYQRLRRHQIFSTRGLPALLHLAEAEDLSQQCVQLTGRLEVMAFEEWARCQVKPAVQATNSIRHELQVRGLLGVLRRIDALGYTSK
jgi:DNA-binding SARP family transcriptional activator